MKKFLRVNIFILFTFFFCFFGFAEKGLAQRSENAPKLAFWDFSWDITEQDAKDLAQANVIMVDVETAFYSPDRFAYIRSLNPDIKILAYVSFIDIRKDAATLDVGTTRHEIGGKLLQTPEWILRQANGDFASWWPGNYIVNITNSAPRVNGERYNEWYPKYFEQRVIQDTKFDGVFFDNCWETVDFVSNTLDFDNDGVTDSNPDKKWREGMKTLFSDIRSRADNAGRKNFIMVCNSGTAYSDSINGTAFEHFPDNTAYGDWVNAMDQYTFILKNASSPRYAFLNTNGSNAENAKTNYQKMRYGLTSALLGNGFFNYDKGDQSHREPDWYYDEYDVDLGEPASERYNLLRKDDPQTLRKGVWAREYERATVFVNSTKKKKKLIFKTRYERVNGTQATSVNTGKNTASVVLRSKDGIILLRRLRLVSNVSFINGGQTKIFTRRGKKVRNSFFSYDASLPAGAQIYRIAIEKKNGKMKKRTIIANGAIVSIYNGKGKKMSEFAPYGSAYSGNISIAVGRGKKKNSRFIAIGRSSESPQVHLYSLKGKKQKTCTPFLSSLSTGVNVGAGNVRGGLRDEIVVAPATGGDAQIRILNHRCKVVDNGFFAFSRGSVQGATVAVGNLNGKGKDEIIVGTGPNTTPQVRSFKKSGKKWKQTGKTIKPYTSADQSGVLVSAVDVDGDGKDEIVTSSFSIFSSF